MTLSTAQYAPYLDPIDDPLNLLMGTDEKLPMSCSFYLHKMTAEYAYEKKKHQLPVTCALQLLQGLEQKVFQEASTSNKGSKKLYERRSLKFSEFHSSLYTVSHLKIILSFSAENKFEKELLIYENLDRATLASTVNKISFFMQTSHGLKACL